MSLPDDEALRQLRHDVRAPLVVVSGFAQLLAGEGDLTPEQRRDYARRIAAAAEELQQLLDERLG